MIALSKNSALIIEAREEKGWDKDEFRTLILAEPLMPYENPEEHLRNAWQAAVDSLREFWPQHPANENPDPLYPESGWNLDHLLPMVQGWLLRYIEEGDWIELEY